jgi:hypothetical protein
LGENVGKAGNKDGDFKSRNINLVNSGTEPLRNTSLIQAQELDGVRTSKTKDSREFSSSGGTFPWEVFDIKNLENFNYKKLDNALKALKDDAKKLGQKTAEEQNKFFSSIDKTLADLNKALVSPELTKLDNNGDKYQLAFAKIATNKMSLVSVLKGIAKDIMHLDKTAHGHFLNLVDKITNETEQMNVANTIVHNLKSVTPQKYRYFSNFAKGIRDKTERARFQEALPGVSIERNDETLKQFSNLVENDKDSRQSNMRNAINENILQSHE